MFKRPLLQTAVCTYILSSSLWWYFLTSFAFTFPLSGQCGEVCVLLIGVRDWSKGLLSLVCRLLVLGKPSNYWSVTVWHRKGRGGENCWSEYARVDAGRGGDWAKEIHHLSDSRGCAVPSWQRHPDCSQRLSRRGEARWATAPVMKGVSLSNTAGSGWTDWQVFSQWGHHSARLLLLISEHKWATAAIIHY